MSKAALFVYRNCYTGGVAGGDMHMGGLLEWIITTHPRAKVYLVHPKDDGQETVYAETQKVPALTYQAPHVGSFFAFIFIVRALFGIWRVKLPLQSGETNTLVASSHFLPDVLPVYIKAKRLPGSSRAVYIHHIVQDMPRPKNLNTLLANMQEKVCFWLIKRRFDKVVVVNQEVAKALKARGFHQDILVSSNFVENTAAKPLAYADKPHTLVFCGRMMPQKGGDTFLKVCKKLQAQVPNFSAVMIGVGPDLEKLKALSAKWRLPVEFTGFASPERKFELLAKSRLFVFPSREEGWGIVVAEALTMGVPVVAYDLPVYKNIFANHLHTVPLGDVAKLTEQTCTLLNRYTKDPHSYQKEQRALRAFATRFTRDSVAAQEYAFLTGGIHG